VNVAGSFLIGILGALAVEHGVFSTEQRIFLITGILGGFTTFSAFSLETRLLFRAGDAGQGALYVGLSLALCLLAVWAGWALGKEVA
jgi:fluoride exporter